MVSDRQREDSRSGCGNLRTGRADVATGPQAFRYRLGQLETVLVAVHGPLNRWPGLDATN
jgi:hypothetical protein